MKKLISLLKFLVKETANIQFNMKKGKGTKVFTSRGIEEDTRKIGNFVKVKDESVIFRPAGGPLNLDAYFTFRDKGPQDIEIKLDDIDINSLRFTLLEDGGKYIEFTAITPEINSKETKKSPLSKLKNILHKPK